MLLLLVAFVSGVLTVLAPCILPLLPIIVGGSVTGGVDRRRAYVVCASLAASVIIFTLVLKVSTALIGIPQEVWQWISGGILIALGFATVFPSLWERLPYLNSMSVGSNRIMSAGYARQSVAGDILVGAALGPVFTTCSPTYFVILATVLPAGFFMGLIDLLAYTAGLTLTLLLVALVGQRLVEKLGLASDPRGWFRRSIGVLFVLVGILIFTGAQRNVETWLLDHVFDVTKLEQKLLEARNPSVEMPQGRPTFAQESGSVFLSASEKVGRYPQSPELVAPDGYINIPPSANAGQAAPITIGQFKGKKVVLVDIWTYSCINCQRTLPYLKDWYEKYSDEGLEIIGVHTPEFAFEKVFDNVQRAVTEEGIRYPVILDNEYRTWNAFGNQYWPRKYLIDIDGYIIYDHIGEGGYAETEAAIQFAVAERAQRLGLKKPDMSDTTKPEVVSEGRVRSPETYFGAWRNSNLGNGTPMKEGVQTLMMPHTLTANSFYLGGEWDFKKEYVENVSKGAQLYFTYDARDVYFVAAADNPVRMRVTRNGGQPLGVARGEDVDSIGVVTIQKDRLYKLIQDDGYGLNTIEIEILDAGLKAYTFTFG